MGFEFHNVAHHHHGSSGRIMATIRVRLQPWLLNGVLQGRVIPSVGEHEYLAFVIDMRLSVLRGVVISSNEIAYNDGRQGRVLER